VLVVQTARARVMCISNFISNVQHIPHSTRALQTTAAPAPAAAPLKVLTPREQELTQFLADCGQSALLPTLLEHEMFLDVLIIMDQSDFSEVGIAKGPYLAVMAALKRGGTSGSSVGEELAAAALDSDLCIVCQVTHSLIVQLFISVLSTQCSCVEALCSVSSSTHMVSTVVHYMLLACLLACLRLYYLYDCM
jgi:hypothetical protein